MNSESSLYQLLPSLSDDDYQTLKEDIRQHGVQIPVIMDEARNIIDGHHRIRAYQELQNEGIELPDYPVSLCTGLDEARKHDMVLTLNLCRRHLTREQKRELVENYLREHPNRSNGYIADLFKVSSTTVATIRDTTLPTLQIGELETKRVGKDGRVRCLPRPGRSILVTSQQDVQKVIKALPHLSDDQGSNTVSGESVVRMVRHVRRQTRRAERYARFVTPPPLDQGEKQYAVILADPPWQYSAGKSCLRSTPEEYYPTMPLEEICALPVPTIAAFNATLYLWATAPLLPEAIQVIEAWGFEYVTGMVWDKQTPTMGFWIKSQHEHLLIAKRGDAPRPNPDRLLPSVISEPRTTHSTKPQKVRDMIVRQYPEAPKIELFARDKADGWDTWGNEIIEEPSVIPNPVEETNKGREE